MTAEETSDRGTIEKKTLTVETRPTLKPTMRVRPIREAALEDSFALISREIEKLRAKSERFDTSLGMEDTSRIVKYLDTFARLVRTDIEHDRHVDPASLSDEDLLLATDNARQLIGGPDIAVEGADE